MQSAQQALGYRLVDTGELGDRFADAVAAAIAVRVPLPHPEEPRA